MTEYEIVTPYLIVTDVKGCSACGGEHKSLHFYQFFDEWKTVCPSSDGVSLYLTREVEQ